MAAHSPFTALRFLTQSTPALINRRQSRPIRKIAGLHRNSTGGRGIGPEKPLDAGSSLTLRAGIPRAGIREVVIQGAVMTVAVALTTGSAWGQWGGGIAISTGLSIQDRANAAAETSANNAGSLAAPPGFNANQRSTSAGMESNYGGGNYGSGSYGGGGYGGGGYGAQASGQRLLQAWADYLAKPLDPRLEQWNPSLLDQAALAMHVGDERQAWALFLAHVIAEPETATAAFDSLRFSPFLRKPSWAIRTGVSLHARVPDQMTASPIRQDSTLQTVRGRAVNPRTAGRNPVDATAASNGQTEPPRFAPPSYPPAGANAGASSNGYGSGAYGLESDASGYAGSPGSGSPAYGSGSPAYGSGSPAYGSGSPAYGSGSPGYDSESELMIDPLEAGSIDPEAPSSYGGASFGQGGTPFVGGIEGRPGAGGAARPGVFVNPAYRSAIDAERLLDGHLGIVNQIFRTELEKRFRDGSFGSVLPELAQRGDTLISQALLHPAGTPVPAEGSLSIWQPGFSFVGTENVDAMLRKAREQDLDLLIHFDVVVRPARLDQQYDARCRIIDVASGNNLVTTGSINRQEVLSNARTRDNATVLVQMLRPAWQNFDERAKLVPLPALKPEQALARVSSLLGQPRPGTLANLAEITYYHQRKLISQEQYEAAMHIAAGEDGLRLTHAPPEQRREVVRRLVEQQLASGE